VLYRNGEYDRDLISTNSIYNSKQEAIDAMKELVKIVREVDLNLSPEVKEAINITQQIKASI
jgi:hypothetical protein